MIYYVENNEGEWFRFDYPCFGMLAELHELGGHYWHGDVEQWNGSYWADCDHSGDYVSLKGLTPMEFHKLCLPIFGGEDVDLSHSFFNNLSKEKVKLPSGDEQLCVVMYFDQETPMDAMFAPLFVARDSLVPTLNKEAAEAVESVVPVDLLPFFATTFYKYTSFNGPVIYTCIEDGGTFGRWRVGDLVGIMRGESPRYSLDTWGTWDRGYPINGVYDDSGDETARSHHDELTNDWKDISSSFCLKRSYEDEFLNQRITDAVHNMSESDFVSFAKEIVKRVQG